MTYTATNNFLVSLSDFYNRTYAVAPHIAFMVRYAALTHPTNRGIA